MTKHKCDGCRYKGEHQEMGFMPFGVCYKEHNLIEAEKAYRAEKCPYKENGGEQMKDNSGSNENATKPYTRGVFEEVVCAKCGKSFIPAVYHKFVDKKKRYYCKWTCYNNRAEKYPDEKETSENERE